ncbi:MAG: DNA mismatch repair endonuclease MutL [Candidatus Binatia bacterium]
MGKIAVLPLDVQGQIAAGEVVERPASVVKELVENALDAGARHIDVRLVGGGLEQISVVDDGEGMTAQDAVLAFARHATSKLTATSDLVRVGTLGFRGEALPSIAAAGRVRLTTRRADAPEGVVVEADGRGARGGGPAGAAPGTMVEVFELFATTPARRKFLRTPATEAGHVVDALTRLAVPTPGTGFRLVADGREVFHYPAVREVRQRLAQVLGAERAASFAAIDGEGQGARVAGLLGPPRESLTSARLLWTYVGFAGGEGGAVRWVRDRVLTHAVLDGYESFVVKGRYPAAVVFVRVAPGQMDVNVHPAKLEVRFQRSSAIHQLVAGTVRARLREALGPAAGDPTAAAPLAMPEHLAETTSTYGQSTHEEAPAEQGGLWQPAARGLRPLRFVGQLFDGYLLCERDGHVVLIDQHAAHERVLYERLQAAHAARGVERDPLLVPEAISLSRTECAVLAEHAHVLVAAGLDGEPFGEGTYLLRTMPRLLRDRDAGALVRALAAELASTGASDAATRAVDAVLATIACHSAVRVGQRMEGGQVDALLAAMEDVPVNAHCPHGRPVAALLRRSAIEALFQR